MKQAHTALAGILSLAAAWAALPKPALAVEAAPGVLRWNGAGVQVYGCKQADSRFAWALIQPDAKLTDASGNFMADHGAGPSWTDKDGSKIVGSVVATVPAPVPGAVAWLVLQASSHEGSGALGHVAFILRTDTEGGAAPATGCDSGHAGAETRIPYRATYTFVDAKPAG